MIKTLPNFSVVFLDQVAGVIGWISGEFFLVMIQGLHDKRFGGIGEFTTLVAVVFTDKIPGVKKMFDDFRACIGIVPGDDQSTAK